MNNEPQAGTVTQPQWQPITATQRRVLGVLVEKAKTTPSGYPLTLNSLTNGCNQKSNRDPVMELETDDVEDALEYLRSLKAVGEVHGDGRVPKYRHYMKDWLAVDGTELAVMAELLLRGAQTVGELRGRAARMASGQLPDMAALRPVLQSLVTKKLVVELTPAGRGQIVTHGLFTDREMREAKLEHKSSGSTDTAAASPPASSPAETSHTHPPSVDPSPNPTSSDVDALQAEVAALRAEVHSMKREIEDIWSNLR